MREVRTFGANITSLLINNFFMQDGLVGSFAKNKISDMISVIRDRKEKSEEQEKQLRKQIDIIGDLLIRKKMLQMYDDYLEDNRIEQEIKFYEEKEVERYRAVTAGQLQKVAQSAFRKENGVILYYKKQIS